MKTRRTNKILALLLAVITVLPLLTGTVSADYEDGQDCVYCGHYHWDDYLCDSCGGCNYMCDFDCWADTHCNECGACLEDGCFCGECYKCEDCMFKDDYKHCTTCWECLDGTDSCCLTCGSCWNCEDECDACGMFCTACHEDNNELCELCRNCMVWYNWCEYDGDHCTYCCELCDGCGDCQLADGAIGFCQDCGLCLACCADASENEGCECGICVMSGDWDMEHFCEGCGEFYCVTGEEPCEYCMLCERCCSDNSECDESMCIADPDYAEHFCIDCGSCFHASEACDSCIDAGDFRCVDCCLDICSSEGCDCGDICINDTDFQDHVAYEHNGETPEDHNHKAKSTWNFNTTNHWNGCRYCDEDVKMNTAPHSFNSFGVCTVCGYNNGADIFIIRQPKDARCKVSDPRAESGDPLFILDNKVTFSVSAAGKGALSYQWYRRTSSGKDIKLTDVEKAGDGSVLHTGGKSAKFTTIVQTDACNDVYAYFCVITDEAGNTVTSDIVYIEASHVFDEAENDRSSPSRFYVKNGSSYTVYTIYNNDGHFIVCHGEGEDVYKSTKPVAHSYGNFTEIMATDSSSNASSGKFDTYYKYTCVDCGDVKFVKKHVHSFKVPIDDMEYLEANTNSTSHPLVCTVTGCSQVRREAHRWQWNIVGWPYGTHTGAMMMSCVECEYWENRDFGKTESGKPLTWNMSNSLVEVTYGTASRSIVSPGDKLTLTPEKRVDKRCYGWLITYIMPNGEGSSGWSASVFGSAFPLTESSDGTWSGTVPAYSKIGNDVTGGGEYVFKALFSECSHTKTEIEGAASAGCLKDGYTGDTVCATCGKIFKVGDPIKARGSHGKLTLVSGTTVSGSCDTRGYEGDYKCADCGDIIKGKTTGYVHSSVITLQSNTWRSYPSYLGSSPAVYKARFNYYKAPTCTAEGFSGDTWCTNCHKTVKYGHTLEPAHGETYLKNVKNATCETNGYTGDAYCKACNAEVSSGYYTPVLGHDWVLSKQTAPTVTERGVTTHTCKRAGCTATKMSYTAKLSMSGSVGSLSAKVTAPVAGAKPAQTATSGDNGKYDVAIYLWFKGELSENSVIMGADETFEAGEKYVLELKFTPKAGYTLSNSATASVNSVTDTAFCGVDSKTGARSYRVTFIIPAAHLHTPEEAWSSDAASHWHVCGGCNQLLNKAPHAFGSWKVTKAATDTEDGSRERVCAVCGYKQTEVLAKLSHTHSYTGAWNSGDVSHWQLCSCGNLGNISAHAYGEWTVIKAAADTEDGSRERICAVCGYKQTEVIPMLSHSHTYSSEMKIDASSHWNECACGEKIGVSNHIYSEWRTEREATASTEGLKSSTCSVCGYVMSVVIPVIGHEHSYSGTWKSDSSKHWQECDCGEISNEDAHTFGEWETAKTATETEDGSKKRVCSVCGYEEYAVIPAGEKETGGTNTATPDTTGADETTPTDPEKPAGYFPWWIILIIIVAIAGIATIIIVIVNKNKKDLKEN